MEKNDSPLALFVAFAPLSLMAFGGGLSIIGDIQRIAVTHGWLSPQTVMEILAISRVAPGPSTLMVTLMGWHIGGLAASLAASVAIFAPSSLLMYAAARLWHRNKSVFWQKAIARGLAPIAAALFFGAIVRLLNHASDAAVAWLIALVTGFLARRSGIGLMTLLALGAALFVALANIRPLLGG